MKFLQLFCASLLVIAVMAGGCGSDDAEEGIFYISENASDFRDSVTFYASGEKKFVLDSMTGFFHNAIRIDSINSQKVFSLFNEINASLYIYDYKEGNILKRISFQLEGPDGIGKNISHMIFQPISSDSFLLINQWDKTFILTNGEGKVLYHQKIDTTGNGPRLFIVSAIGRNPVFRNGSKVYVPCVVSGKYIRQTISSVKTLLIFDIKTRKFDYGINMLPLYDERTWGQNLDKYALFGVFNPNNQYYYYSFPISPYVFKYDLSQKRIEDSTYVGSQHFEKILPYPDKINTDNIGKNLALWEKLKLFDLTNPHFDFLLFDRHRNLFYRHCFLPRTKDEYLNNKNEPKESIIILDSSLKKIGEFNLPPKVYDTRMVLVSEEGLMIAKRDSYQQQEDALGFSVLKIKNKDE